MDLSTGGNLVECRQDIVNHSTIPIGTVPIYSMIIGRKIEELTYDMILQRSSSGRPFRASIISRFTPAF